MSQVLDRLVKKGLLDEPAALGVRTRMADGATLREALALGGMAEEKLLHFLAQELGMAFIEVEKEEVTKEFLQQFPAKVLLEGHVLPLPGENGDTLVAIHDPFDTSAVDQLRLATGRSFRIGLAPLAEIDRQVKRFLGVGADTVQSLISEAGPFQILDADADDDMDLTEAAEGASIIKFVNQILSEAIDLRATDVHIEPFEKELRVRYRVDGVLQQASVAQEVKQFQPAIVSRLKILAKLDIAEKRVPQDGRIKIRINEREIDVRVSVIPMLYGEAVVLRLLDRGAMLMGLHNLGMSDSDLPNMEMILERPHGILLVTGPTGSGKTTTLYASLAHINDIERKIITIEDPIEYQLHGINQIQVSRKAGLSFASGLRSILRHDPDVVLVGEIRDLETAEIAIQASLTGHLVFSTLHTNDAPSALTRLVDMGIEPYLVASSLEAVLAQRLVRVICQDCKTPLPAQEVIRIQKQYGENLPDTLYEGRGCRSCGGTGYRGRQGIFEMMVVTDELRSLILGNVSARDLRRVAVKQGMTSLREDGLRYLAEGHTTIREILRVTKDESFSDL
jgi:general secretion pathway protein E/type IV pilus assembly protein PilB